MKLENQEFIGKKTEVKTHNNTFKGTIINETKFTIKIRTANGDKMILKKNNIFKINNQEINGNKIMKRPEERIKL